MSKKTLSLLLAAAMTLSLCGIPALAADPAEDSAAAQTGETVQTPDPEGTLSFENLAARVEKNDLNYLVLAEKVAQIDATNYDKLKEELRDGLNEIANDQWQITTGGAQINTGMPALDSALQGMMAASTSTASHALQVQHDALREQYDDLKDGKLQKTAADGVRQLEDMKDSVVMVAQGLYVQLDELNAAGAGVDRALAALDRQIAEMELRHQMGQISDLTLRQLEGGRASLVSRQQSLAVSARTLTMNLEAMAGAPLTGTLSLAALPRLSAEELDAMDVETDLAAAKEASYTLYAAKKTLDDAKEVFEDAGKEYNHNEKKYQYVQAQHVWQAAQYTYQGAVQTFELTFRTLYATVKNDAQALSAAQTALAVEQASCAADELKYQQGSISKNALLAAKDDLSTAQDTVNTARRTLFSDYNNYRWAVDHGILNR